MRTVAYNVSVAMRPPQAQSFTLAGTGASETLCSAVPRQEEKVATLNKSLPIIKIKAKKETIKEQIIKKADFD